jgi:hypothetical protein
MKIYLYGLDKKVRVLKKIPNDKNEIVIDNKTYIIKTENMFFRNAAFPLNLLGYMENCIAYKENNPYPLNLYSETDIEKQFTNAEFNVLMQYKKTRDWFGNSQNMNLLIIGIVAIVSYIAGLLPHLL